MFIEYSALAMVHFAIKLRLQSSGLYKVHVRSTKHYQEQTHHGRE